MNKLLASYVSKVCVAGTTISRHKAVPATQVRYTKNTCKGCVAGTAIIGGERVRDDESEASL